MGKTLLKATGIILAILIVAFAVLSLGLDGIVKTSVQQTGTALFKTDVEVDDLSLSLFNGEGTVEGVMVQNPEKFERRPAIAMRQIRLRVDLSTLFSDTVVVDELVVQQPELYAEQTMEGNNLKTLLDNLASSAESSGPAEAYLVVDCLVIESGTVEISSNIVEERTAKAEIDRIELTGVGRQGNNTVDQTVRRILKPVLEQAVRAAIRRGVLDAVEGELQDLLSG